jgi:hypothetical protein
MSPKKELRYPYRITVAVTKEMWEAIWKIKEETGQYPSDFGREALAEKLERESE